MATTDLKIKIKVDKDTGELVVAKKEFDKLGNSVDKTERNTQRFNDRLADMAHAAAAVWGTKQAFDAMLIPVREIIKVSSEFERQESILKVLEGDSKKAQKSLEWIKSFASRTPYEINKVTEAFIKAKSYGIDPTNGTLKTLGDTASAMGKDINQAVEAMADAMVGENERLKEFGIRASVQGEKVAYSWTSASGQAKNIIVDNNSKIIESTLNSIFNSKYEDAMNEQMSSWNGLVSNMQDQYMNFINDIGQQNGLFDSFKLALSDVSGEFEKLSQNEDKMHSLGLVTKEAFLISAKGVQALTYAGTGALWLFESIGTILSQTANNAELAFLSIERNYNEMLLGLTNNANAVLPDFLLKKLGTTDQTVKDLKRNLAESQKAVLDQEKVILEREKEHYDFIDGLNTVNETVSKTISKIENYTGEIDKNTKSKKENKKADFGNDGELKEIEVKTIKDKQESISKLEELEEKHYLYKLGLEQELLENKKQYQKAWMIEREKLEAELFENDIDLTSKLAKEKIAIEKKEYFDKFLKENKKVQKEAVKDVETTWDRVSKNMYDSFDDYFFSKFKEGISGLTDELGIFGDVLDPILRDVSSSLANSFTPNLQSLINGSSSSSSIHTVDINKLSSQGFMKSDDGSWSKDSANGGTIKVNSSGVVTAGANLLSGKTSSGIGLGDALNLTTLPSSISNIGNLISNPGSITSGISSFIADPMTAISNKYTASIMSPTSSIASLFPAGGAANVGINSFGAGMSSPFTAAGANFGGNSMAYAGGQALVGGAIGYGVGSIGDKIFGADTHAATAGTIGGAIGTAILPGIGTAIGAGLGSIIGGIFGKSKTSVEGSGLKVLDVISEENSSFLKEYTDYVKKKKSWFNSSTSRWTTLQNVDSKTMQVIESSFKTLNNIGDILLDQTSTNISIGAGKYSGSSLITSVIPNALIDEVSLYGSTSKEWKRYAKEVNKTLVEVLSESTYEFQDALRNMSIFSQRDDAVAQLKLQSKYAQEDYKALGEATGISLARITVDNFNERYRDAIRRDFTQETIEQWRQLGDALMSATKAQEQYKEALEQEQKRKEQELKQQRLESLQTLNAQKANALELKALQDRYNQEQKTYLQNAINQVRGLSNDFERFMDTLENTIYDLQGKNSSNQSQNYLISQFWDKKTKLDELLEKDGNVNKQEAIKMQDLIKEISTISTNIQSSFGDNNTLITNSLVNELQGIDLELNKDNEILKTQIVDAGGNDVGVSTEGTLTSLTNAINDWNDSISDKLEVDEELKFKEFKAGGLLSTEDEIRFRQSFEAESAETYKKELEDLRSNLSYLSLETTDRSKYLQELYEADENAFENIMEFFKSTDNLDSSFLGNLLNEEILAEADKETINALSYLSIAKDNSEKFYGFLEDMYDNENDKYSNIINLFEKSDDENLKKEADLYKKYGYLKEEDYENIIGSTDAIYEQLLESNLSEKLLENMGNASEYFAKNFMDKDQLVKYLEVENLKNIFGNYIDEAEGGELAEKIKLMNKVIGTGIFTKDPKKIYYGAWDLMFDQSEGSYPSQEYNYENKEERDLMQIEMMLAASGFTNMDDVNEENIGDYWKSAKAQYELINEHSVFADEETFKKYYSKLETILTNYAETQGYKNVEAVKHEGMMNLLKKEVVKGFEYVMDVFRGRKYEDTQKYGNQLKNKFFDKYEGKKYSDITFEELQDFFDNATVEVYGNNTLSNIIPAYDTIEEFIGVYNKYKEDEKSLEDYLEPLLGQLNSYDVGTSYVSHDQTANIHKGEKIIDPQSSEILNKYGIKVHTNSNNLDNNKLDELIKYLKNIQNLTQQNGNEIKKLRKITEYGVV